MEPPAFYSAMMAKYNKWQEIRRASETERHKPSGGTPHTLPAILLSVCLSALITLLIVGYHIQKVMKQNPAEILAKE